MMRSQKYNRKMNHHHYHHANNDVCEEEDVEMEEDHCKRSEMTDLAYCQDDRSNNQTENEEDKQRRQ